MIKKFLINIIYIFLKKCSFTLVHIAMLVINFHVWVPVYLNLVIFATTLNLCSPSVVFANIVCFNLIHIFWVANHFSLPL